MTTSAKKKKITTKTWHEKSALLTMANEFYIQRFVREEKVKTELTRQDFIRIFQQISHPE